VVRSSSFTRARSQFAQLSGVLAPGDPVLAAAHQHMREAFVVHKVADILDKGPALTPQMRAEIEQLLADREVVVA
jgi:hypothetical protein